MDVTKPLRATRLSAWRRISRWPGMYRAPSDQAEAARRVEIYAMQIRQQGRISYLPHRDVVNP